jgi:Ca2+-binding RTX toxin-like protein
LDPSGIGRKVVIEFNLNNIPRTLDAKYELSEFQNDVATMVSPSVGYFGVVTSSLRNDVLALADQLSVTDSLNVSGNKPVIYGTQLSDNIRGAQTVTGVNLLFHPRLAALMTNGIVYVAGPGDDTVTGTSWNDEFFGGAGSDTLRGGGGDDTYVYTLGDGLDYIEDDDGSIRFSGVTLSGAGAVLRGGNQTSTRWDWQSGGQTITYTLASNGDLSIEGVFMALGDRLVIRDWEDGDLGISLPRAPTAAFNLGPSDPWDVPGFTPSPVDTTLAERSSRQFTVAMNRPATEGERLRLTISGSSGNARVQTGAETLEFVNGALELELTPGQNLTVLSLLSVGDFDVDDEVVLTATYLDAQGNPYGTSATMNVLFEAVDEPMGIPPFDDEHIQTTPVTFSIDGITGNNHLVGYDGGTHIEWIRGRDGSDWLEGRGGRDMLFGFYSDTDTTPPGVWIPDGDDILEGGAESDLMFGGGGADRIYADTAVALDAAIVAGNSAPSLSGQGDFMGGGQGHDTIVGADRGDVLGGGEGNDVLVGGGGDDLINGDIQYTAGLDVLFNFPTLMTTWSIGLTINGDSYNYFVTGASFIDEIVYIDQTGLVVLREDYEGGADTIYAGTGNDGVLAGGGDDFVDAGPDNDNVFGADGNDTLLGGSGNDLLDGGDANEGETTGNDFLDGGAGDDNLQGSDFDDVLYGGAGNDTLNGDDATT